MATASEVLGTHDRGGAGLEGVPGVDTDAFDAPVDDFLDFFFAIVAVDEKARNGIVRNACTSATASHDELRDGKGGLNGTAVALTNFDNRTSTFRTWKVQVWS